MTRLDVEHLSKRFGGLTAVQDLSFSVAAGEVLGIVGTNGSGKTTTFNLITGFVRPDTGRVTLDGRELTRLAPHEIVHAGVARTFQLVRVFRRLTVAENIAAAVCVRTRGAHERAERVGELLRVVGLDGKAHQEVASLPIGDLTRVEIGRTLATRPRVLLLDEPFSGLSHAEVSQIAALLRALTDQGLAVIIVEHVLRELRRLTENVIVLDFGVKIAEGLFDEVITRPVVREAYLGGVAGA